MLAADVKARNLAVERRNLVLLCRFTIKTVIDKASVQCIEEDSSDVINLIAALEHVLSHGIKKVRSWLSDGQGCYYDFVFAACQNVPNHCLSTVKEMGQLKDGLSKGRAWLKLALMEKRLSVYLSAALQQQSLTRTFYHEDAIILSEDMSILTQDMLGLSALDFSFCLKWDSGCSSELMLIDLAPYLRFHQCDESIRSDIQEAEKSLKPSHNDVCLSEDSVNHWEEKFSALQKQHKHVCEQKAYVEDVCHQKSSRLVECQLRAKQLCQKMTQDAAAWAAERRHHERLIICLRREMQQLSEQLEQERQRDSRLLHVNEQQQDGERKHFRQTAADMALACRSELSVTAPDTSTFGDSLSIKDESSSLRPLIGSLCSQPYMAIASDNTETGCQPIVNASSGYDNYSRLGVQLGSSNLPTATDASTQALQNGCTRAALVQTEHSDSDTELQMILGYAAGTRLAEISSSAGIAGSPGA